MKENSAFAWVAPLEVRARKTTSSILKARCTTGTVNAFFYCNYDSVPLATQLR
jgi:hypothetical protein